MNLRSRLSALIAARVALSTVLLGWAIFIQVSRDGAQSVGAFFFLIGLTCALSVLYLATLRLATRWPWLVDAQFGCDALLVSGFIAVTGGITSFFSSLYLLLIIAASMIRYRRGAVQVSLLSGVLYLGIVAAQYLDARPLSTLIVNPQAELPSLEFAQYTVGINLLGFFAVGLLSSSLAERLRRADARLERASHQMADLRAFNEYVIDSLSSGLVTTDQAGRILTFNAAAGGITGVPADAAVGRDVGDVLQLPQAFRASLDTIDEKRSLRLDLEYRTKERGVIEVGLAVTTLFFPDASHGFLATFQDVTAVKRLERDARLRQRLAAIGEMAAAIAHEIRNPLASMSGSIQVLRGELSLSDEQAQLMDIVLRESDRLNDTIRSLLAYARPQQFTIAKLDVRRTLQDTALLLRNSAEVHADHQVIVDVPGEPVWYEADENQIRQIVWNLATNGLRAMAEGGRLRLALRNDIPADGGGAVVMTVEDTGRGMTHEEVDGIFQPFHSSFERGTGLGLAIAHRIVADYNGAIRVSSKPGQGTLMRVSLPLRAPDLAAARTLEAIAAGGAS